MAIWEKFTKEEIQKIVNESTSNKEVAEKLGYSWDEAHAGGAACALKNMYKKLSINTDNLSNNNFNIINKRFGFLTVINYISSEHSGGKHPYVICQCDCGKIIKTRTQHLHGWISGSGNICHTISCGCKKASSGEILIESLLYEHHINYQTQYRISDFNKSSSFDFAIFNRDNMLLYLIEFDGQQHFKPIDYWGGEKEYKKTIERDQNKNQYCIDNNISLIRIPYYDFNQINWEYLINKMPKLVS